MQYILLPLEPHAGPRYMLMYHQYSDSPRKVQTNVQASMSCAEPEKRVYNWHAPSARAVSCCNLPVPDDVKEKYQVRNAMTMQKYLQVSFGILKQICNTRHICSSYGLADTLWITKQ